MLLTLNLTMRKTENTLTPKSISAIKGLKMYDMKGTNKSVQLKVVLF